ncbi:unnamed protein product [Moneuplotes crassus]|uniref:FHA domain-containing protein n=1 Tax=Euplotes crassus TaxID=5936 RepID=A0AAD2D8M1_EUPCR|nr:unnamed protein product [Moneuplotes crassus]
MGYIHYDCIKAWMDSKKTITDRGNYVRITWKDIKCELCKSPVSCMENQGNNTPLSTEFEIFNFPRPKSNHWVMFEAQDTEHFADEQEKSYHIFDFRHKKNLIVGRGYKADARINDISISRIHAFLRVRDKEIWLEDADSKFDAPYNIKPGTEATSFQVGRTLFQIKAVRLTCFDKLLRHCTNQDNIIKGKNFKKFKHEFPTQLQQSCSNKKLRFKKVCNQPLDPVDREFNSIDSYSESFAFAQNPRAVEDSLETYSNNLDHPIPHMRSSIIESSHYNTSNKEESKNWEHSNSHVEFVKSENRWGSIKPKNLQSFTVKREKKKNMPLKTVVVDKSRTENNRSALSSHQKLPNFSIEKNKSNIPKFSFLKVTHKEENKSHDDQEDILNSNFVDELLKDPIIGFEYPESESRFVMKPLNNLMPPSQNLN